MKDYKVDIEVRVNGKKEFESFFNDLRLFLGNHDVILLVKELDVKEIKGKLAEP